MSVCFYPVCAEWNLFIVLVTYNRSDLLRRSLDSLIKTQRKFLKRIYIYDNASTDNTKDVVDSYKLVDDRIYYIRLSENIGGAGGFSLGVKTAFDEGATWIGLIDDDVVISETCLEVLSGYSKKFDCMCAVRQNLNGDLAEYAAIEYNLVNPLKINPKVKSYNEKFKIRNSCPDSTEVNCASFEGLFVNSKIVKKIGYPHAEYFIYGDDFDYCIRMRLAGYKIFAIRDAVIVRQLEYSKTKFRSWKTYYIWRNFFIIHFLYGKNLLVRLKPFFVFPGFVLLNLIKGGEQKCFKVLFDAIKVAKKIKSSNEL